MAMTNAESSPFLQFDFVDAHGVQTSKSFSQPENVLSASRLEDVLPALQEVQKAVRSGYYAAGYLSYEAAPAFDPALRVQKKRERPLLWFGIFAQPSEPDCITKEDRAFHVSAWESATQPTDYKNAVSEIQKAIQRGETYQVNYTMRLRASFEGDDYAFYRQLVRAQQSNYSAYLNTGRYRVLSASPELFFRVDGHTITTRPMKGTVQRGRWPQEDQAYASWLYHSEKNRAENVMIVDLLRNDLGRIAENIRVPKLFDIEPYPTVHQMTSTITAELSENVRYTDIFKALFPCGSVTGAPKVSTMDLIARLEDEPRGVYCGTIGYFSPQGEAVFNVPIRTVVLDRETGQAEYGVGGGITWDSTTDGEYSEAWTKTRFLTTPQPDFKLLETIKLDRGRYDLFHRHLRRLEQSARYFQFSIDTANIQKQLEHYARQHPKDVRKVRLLVAKNGESHIEGTVISPLSQPQTVVLSDHPVPDRDPFLFHKTTHRSVYETHRSRYPDGFDVLLWNKDGALTEFTTGNLVVEMEDRLWTPSRECGLLAGTLREELLENKEVEERVLKKEDLPYCSRLWYINGVRGWIAVQLAEPSTA